MDPMKDWVSDFGQEVDPSGSCQLIQPTRVLNEYVLDSGVFQVWRFDVCEESKGCAVDSLESELSCNPTRRIGL